MVTDEQGHSTRLQAGDVFVLSKGFSGTWEVVEPTLKRFVMYEPATASV